MNEVEIILIATTAKVPPHEVKSLQFTCSATQAEQIKSYLVRMGVNAPREEPEGTMVFNVGAPKFVRQELQKQFF